MIKTKKTLIFGRLMQNTELFLKKLQTQIFQTNIFKIKIIHVNHTTTVASHCESWRMVGLACERWRTTIRRSGSQWLAEWPE
jgi:hypothetical protein